jgi:membrane-associated phospholipid phosphatase
VNWHWLASNDLAVSFGIANHISFPNPWLRPLDRWLTLLADWRVLLAVVLLAALVLVLRGGRGRWSALLVLLALPLALGLTSLVKELVHRPRFQHVWISPKPEGYSFPSGSALSAAAVYGSVGLLLGRRLRGGGRVGLCLAAFLLPFVIGVSRLFVLHHYLSDVFAGWGAGLAIALFCRGVDGLLDPDAGKQRTISPLPEEGPAPRFEEIAAPKGAVAARQGVGDQEGWWRALVIVPVEQLCVTTVVGPGLVLAGAIRCSRPVSTANGHEHVTLHCNS